MDASKILLRSEIVTVLGHLKRQKRWRSVTMIQNLVIFRLSCCCGLRVKEICGLNLGDFVVDGPRPVIRIRKAITKGRPEKRRARLVPLWWDAGTREDIADWLRLRASQGASSDSPFVCSQKLQSHQRLKVKAAQKRWETALRVLGAERVKQLSIHCGRHSFCSHALRAGRTLAEVRDAAGHANIATTSIYLHVLGDEHCPDVFSMEDE